MPENPYTLAEIAELVGKSPATVRYWVTTGRLEAYKDPGDPRRWLVDRSAINKLMASSPAWTRQRKETKSSPPAAPQPEPRRGPQRPGRSISDLMGTEQ